MKKKLSLPEKIKDFLQNCFTGTVLIIKKRTPAELYFIALPALILICHQINVLF